jgi:polyphosphate kinase 2 (PPK2 family)
MIQIFNRSHYEDILVPTVEELLPQEVIDKRYEHINNFEKLLTDHDTIVLKFYLHISSKEQKKRLKERMEDPHKYWKHNDDDRDSRKKWDDYMDVYVATCGRRLLSTKPSLVMILVCLEEMILFLELL